MGVVDGAADACKQVQYFAGGRKISHPRCVADVLVQCLSVDVIHDHVGGGGVINHVPTGLGKRGLEVVDLDDVGMVKGGNHAGFTDETLHEVWIVLQISMEELDGNIALKLCVEGLPDLGHATAT